MNIPIRNKPHHFVDIVRTVGSGQVAWEPHPYGHNLQEVAERIAADRDATLQIELDADDICEPCIHNADGRCRDVIASVGRYDDWGCLFKARGS